MNGGMGKYLPEIILGHLFERSSHRKLEKHGKKLGCENLGNYFSEFFICLASVKRPVAGTTNFHSVESLGQLALSDISRRGEIVVVAEGFCRNQKGIINKKLDEIGTLPLR